MQRITSKSRLAFALALAAAAQAGCDEGANEPGLPPGPGIPISSPLAGDLARPEPAAGCREPVMSSRWDYTWADDRLAEAREVDGAGQPMQQHRFEYDAAGRLMAWDGPTPTLRHQIERDADGLITSWTRTEGDRELAVRITREADTLTVTTAGLLYVDFSRPPLIDLARLDPDWERLAPRMGLIIDTLSHLTGQDDTDGLWRVLDDSAMTQIEQQTDTGGLLTIDIDGDMVPDVRVATEATADGVTTTIDYADDGVVDVVSITRDGVTDRVDYAVDGSPWRRTRTEAAADHLFVDGMQGDVIVSRTSLFFDDAGQRLIKYEDDDADGRPNWRKRYVVDPVTGLRSFDERDSGANGHVDERVEYARNAAGDVLQLTRFQLEGQDCGATW